MKIYWEEIWTKPNQRAEKPALFYSLKLCLLQEKSYNVAIRNRSRRLENKRWYDKFIETERALELLQKLSPEAQKKIAKDMLDVASAIKNVNKENSESPLSLGLRRVLGLYQSSQNRRWYDKNKNLSIAMKTVSTLPESDYVHVMEGLCMSVKD